jgi:uncharacterized protein YmfQ (DUF2313 family)
MTQLYQEHTDEEQTQVLADLLPSGDAWIEKNLSDSTFRQYLRIFAPEMNRYEKTMLEFSREVDINNADVYLKRWERALGIPDDCFLGTGTLEERRLHVIVKLACMNVSTEQDFIDLAQKLGVSITLQPLVEQPYPPYTIPMTPTAQDTFTFKWLIRGENLAPNYPPYNIPYFLTTTLPVVSCILNKVKPAFIELIFLNPDSPLPISGYDSGYDSGYGA